MRCGGASFDEAGVESDWVRSQAVNPQSEWSDGAEALFERPDGKRRLSGSSPRDRRLKHGACFLTLSTIRAIGLFRRRTIRRRNLACTILASG
jgi:hypothetical protein